MSEHPDKPVVNESTPEPMAESASGSATAAAGSPTSSAAPSPAEASAEAEALRVAASEKWPLPALLQQPAFRLKVVIGALALLLALQWWNARTDVTELRREVAQRLQSGELNNSQTKLIASRVDDELKVLQGKVAVLEAKQIESQGQQLALEQLYQDLAKNRDDWALAEIEQVLSTASQQLELAGNIRGALIALQNADTRLSRADRPQFIAIRRAIAKDMENLKSLPNIDLTGIALRLDTLVAEIDSMPLLADEKPAQLVPPNKTRLKPLPASGSAAVSAVPVVEDDWRSRWLNRWHSWSSDLWHDIRDLVRIRTVGSPEALLLSPGQAFFARENLKLRLLNARLALLSRNDAAFRSDLAEADRALSRYFDTRSRQTQAGREQIRELQESVLNIEMPTLSHSLNAVRQSRSRP
jgi:uroporphyrin-3 C-methyltransferase/uroporphyrinogen III methyltransferase/synthase